MSKRILLTKITYVLYVAYQNTQALTNLLDKDCYTTVKLVVKEVLR